MAETNPPITAAALADIAADDTPPEDMLLIAADGTLSTAPASADIRDYQHAGQWPRYVCRMLTVYNALARQSPEDVAAVFTRRLAVQLALDTPPTGPHATE